MPLQTPNGLLPQKEVNKLQELKNDTWIRVIWRRHWYLERRSPHLFACFVSSFVGGGVCLQEVGMLAKHLLVILWKPNKNQFNICLRTNTLIHNFLMLHQSNNLTHWCPVYWMKFYLGLNIVTERFTFDEIPFFQIKTAYWAFSCIVFCTINNVKLRGSWTAQIHPSCQPPIDIVFLKFHWIL